MNGSFEHLLSLAEAADAAGVDPSTIRHAIRNGRLIEGTDCRLFGKQWVITAEALPKISGQKWKRSWLDRPYGQWVEPYAWGKRREEGIPMQKEIPDTVK